MRVVNHLELPLEHISFATRAVRVIDNMTQYDMAGFSAVEGMRVIAERVVVSFSIYLIKKCKLEIFITFKSNFISRISAYWGMCFQQMGGGVVFCSMRSLHQKMKQMR